MVRMENKFKLKFLLIHWVWFNATIENNIAKDLNITQTPIIPNTDFEGENNEFQTRQTNTPRSRSNDKNTTINETENVPVSMGTELTILETEITTQYMNAHMSMTARTETYIDDFCYEYGFCEKPADVKTPWYCNCDELCEEYNDCCLQYNRSKHHIRHQRHRCIQRNTDESDLFGFFAIANCPTGYDNESVTEICRHGNIQTYGPPVVSHGRTIYRNIYCAICHNGTDFVTFDIQFYNINQKFNEVDDINNLSRDAKLHFLFKEADYYLLPPTNINVRACLLNLIVNENTHCNDYINPMYSPRGETFYRNSFCMPDDINLVRLKCFARYMRSLNQLDIIAISVIFSFGETASTEKPDRNKCSEWTEQTHLEPECSKIATYINYRMEIEYYLIANKLLSEIYKIKTYALLSAWNLQVPNVTQIEQIEMFIEDKSTIKIRNVIKFTKRSFLSEINRMTKTMVEQSITIRATDNETNASEFIRKEQLSLLFINDSENAERIGKIRFGRRDLLTVLSDNNIRNIDQNYMYLDLDCSEATVELLWIAEEVSYIKTCLCQDQTANENIGIPILSVLTYVCFSVSVFAVFCLIIFNRRCRNINTIADSNLENLSISLLIANLLFMFGIGASSIAHVCYAIGVMLHYLWLTVFSFMTIAVVYIVTNITQIKARLSARNDQEKFKRRIITFVGLLIPVLIVGPAVVVDIYGPSYLSLGYGGSVCFPNRYPSNVIFFSGPVLLSITINCVSLVQIIATICRVRIEMKNIRKSSSYHDAKIYLRIVVISGVFWSVGILGAVTKFEWLDYVFTILCGLQGFCIVVANLTTSRNKFCKKSLNLQKPPLSTNTTGI